MAKKMRIAVVIAVIALTGIGIGAGCFLHSRCDEVMKVNGITVGKEEFQIIMDEQVSQVYSHYKSQYGIEDSVDFWNIKAGGMTPCEYNKELAKQILIRKKCTMQLMMENHMIEDVSFDTFKKQWKQENERRKNAKNRGEVIYGPVEYGLREYDIYLMSNREIELKQILADGPLSVTEEEMHRYYEENKDIKYKVQDTITAIIDAKTVVFEPQFARHDSTEQPELHEAVLTMTEGEKKTVILENGEQSVITCVKKEGNGYLPFDDAKDSIIQALTDEKYEVLIKARMQAAEVEINLPVYERIKRK